MTPTSPIPPQELQLFTLLDNLTPFLPETPLLKPQQHPFEKWLQDELEDFKLDE